MSTPLLMTVAEAARQLACSKNTIYRMVKFRKLRIRNIGTSDRTYRILAEDVYAIVNPPVAYTSGLKRRFGAL